VPSNGTRRRSCGEVLLCEMREHGGVDPVYATVSSEWCRFGRIEDAAQVFDEMPIRTVPKNARVLLLDETSRVQDAVGRMLRRCTDAARQGRSNAGPADEKEEEQQHEVVQSFLPGFDHVECSVWGGGSHR
jgi:hypothetical protein